MGRKKKEVKEQDRRTYLKEELISHITEICPELNRRFDIFKIKRPKGSKGTFRDWLEGDLKDEDSGMFRDILQELKKDGALTHIAGRYWARLR